MSRSTMLRGLVPIVAIGLFAFACEGLVRLIDPEIAIPGDERRFRYDQRHQRTALYHERDDELGWRLVRGQLVRAWIDDGASSPDETPPMRTNREGFRGPDFEIQKAPGVFRILVAGDSNAMGFGVAHDERIYSAGVETLLNRELASRGVRAEVVNLGVDGFSSHQVRLVLQRYAPVMAPDVVCVQVGFNDHCLTAVADAAQRYERPRVLNTLERSHAYRWLRRQVLLITGTRSGVHDPVPRVSPEAHEANIRAIADLCTDIGASLFLLTTPPKPGMPLVMNEVPIDEGNSSTWMTQSAWLEAQLEKAGIAEPYSPEDPRCLAVVDDAIARHPEWPMLHFMRSRYLLARGERDAAVVAHQMAMQLDAERVHLRGYMNRQREVSLTHANVWQVDVESALDRFAAETGLASVGDLYVDFVHLGERGHVVIATELASRIAEQIVGREAGRPRR